MKIKAPETHETLLEVVNGPVKSHLPYDPFVIGTSTKGTLVSDLEGYMCKRQTETRNLVFVIGCTSTGNYGYEADYTHDCLSLSHYSLSS